MTAAALWASLARRFGGGGAALVALLVLLVALLVATSAWRGLSSKLWRGEAKKLEVVAGTAQANAESANAGAANATRTRGSMGAAVAEIHDRTETAARRVETHEDHPAEPVAGSPLDPASLRELEVAWDRARAAADRLRGTR